jgi:hypothetical protein
MKRLFEGFFIFNEVLPCGKENRIQQQPYPLA